jgi:hypothetical protein
MLIKIVYSSANKKNIPLNGTIILEKLHKYSQQLRHINFKDIALVYIVI